MRIAGPPGAFFRSEPRPHGDCPPGRPPPLGAPSAGSRSLPRLRILPDAIGAALLGLSLLTGCASGDRRGVPLEQAHVELQTLQAHEAIGATDLGRRLAEIWKRELATWGTKEHLQILTSRDVVMARTGGLLDSQSYAGFEASGLYVHHGRVEDMIRQLGSRGVPRAEAEEVVAIKLCGVAAHEIRHGLVDQALVAKTGLSYPVSSREEEMLGVLEQAEALTHLMARYPDIFGNQRYRLEALDRFNESVLNIWERGPDGLRTFVRYTYPGVPEISTVDPSQMAELHRNNLSAIARTLQRREQLEAWAAAGADVARELHQLPPRSELIRVRAKASIAASVLENPEDFARVRTYYEGAVLALSAEYAKPKWVSWRAERSKARDARISGRMEAQEEAIDSALTRNNRATATSVFLDLMQDYERLSPGARNPWNPRIARWAPSFIPKMIDDLDRPGPSLSLLETLERTTEIANSDALRSNPRIYERVARKLIWEGREDARRGNVSQASAVLLRAEAYATRSGADLSAEVAAARRQLRP